MNIRLRGTIILAVTAIVIVLNLSSTILQAEDHRTAPATAHLEPLESSPQLLQAPDGLQGDFAVAEAAPTVEFAVFPGQWEGARLWSSWGDALFASDGKFYASIGDHGAPHGTAYVYRIDPDSGMIERVVDYNSIVGIHDEDKYTPGKIHAALVDGQDGRIYFFGYRGSVRRTGPETGFRGDWLLRYDLESGKTDNLGIPVADCSVPVLRFDRRKRALVGLAVPGRTAESSDDRFFRYPLDGKDAWTGGPTPNISRAMILAHDGRAWYSTDDPESGRSVFARSDPENKRVVRLDVPVPGDGMLRAASRPDKDGVVYAISKDGLAFTFDTKTERVEPMTKCFVAEPLYTATCRLDPTGRYLYYVPGAHGRTSRIGTPVIQLDVRTGQRKVLAFLNEFVRERENYNLGGTYGLALNEDGSRLFINWNGSRLPAEKHADFGLCAAMVLHIPETERSPNGHRTAR